MTPERAHLYGTTTVAAAVATLGAVVGAAAGGPGIALAVGAITGGGALIGGFLTRGRALTAAETAQSAAARSGYVDGRSDSLLATISQYEAAVFPASPDGVTPEERAVRRAHAYKVASDEALPHPLREAAAAALEALDAGDLHRSQDTITTLFYAVRKQTAGR